MKPRYTVPGSYYFLTRRCSMRQFLLKADKETITLFLYARKSGFHEDAATVFDILQRAVVDKAQQLVAFLYRNHHDLRDRTKTKSALFKRELVESRIEVIRRHACSEHRPHLGQVRK